MASQFSTNALLSAGPSYFLGSAFLGLGILGITSPSKAQLTFGVNIGPAISPSSVEKVAPSLRAVQEGSGVAYLYSKAGRDVALGATFLFLQYQGNTSAIAAFTGIISFCGAVDGYAVWKYGTGELREKAWGHWGGTACIAAVAALQWWAIDSQ